MYVYFDSSYKVKEMINDKLLVAGANRNVIYAMFESDQGDSTIYTGTTNITYRKADNQVKIENADETLTDSIPVNTERDLYFFEYGKTYRFRKFEIPDEVLSNDTESSVAINATITYVIPSGSTGAGSYPMERFAFNVAPNSAKFVEYDGYVSLAQYSDLNSRITTTTLPSITGNAGKYLKVNSTENGTEWSEVASTSKQAASGGADLSLVTTGEKYTWNNKQDTLSSTNKLNPSYIDTDSNNRFVSDTEKSTWGAKQNALPTTATGKVAYSDGLGGFYIDTTQYATAEQINNKQDKLAATGSATNPVYVSSAGVISACSYELNKTVPTDAVFTDTTYSDATASTAGLMSATDKTKLDGIATGATKVDTYIKQITSITENGQIVWQDQNGNSNDARVYPTVSSSANGKYLKVVSYEESGVTKYKTSWEDGSGGGGGSGTVTSVATGTGLTGGPITTSGTISVDTSVIATKNSVDTLAGRVSTNEEDIVDLMADKQDLLVSGTNIKTINNNSILGSGNIAITGSGTTVFGIEAITSIKDANNVALTKAGLQSAGAIGSSGLQIKSFTVPDGSTTSTITPSSGTAKVGDLLFIYDNQVPDFFIGYVNTTTELFTIFPIETTQLFVHNVILTYVSSNLTTVLSCKIINNIPTSYDTTSSSSRKNDFISAIYAQGTAIANGNYYFIQGTSSALGRAVYLNSTDGSTLKLYYNLDSTNNIFSTNLTTANITLSDNVVQVE